MTIAELLNLTRGIYLTEGVGDFLWIDSISLSMFSEAQRQACNRTDFIYEELTIPLVNGTALYTLNSRITRLNNVMFEGLPVIKTTPTALDYTNSTWRTDTAMSGKECSYVVRGNQLRFVPAPALADNGLVVTLECYTLPAANFTLMTDVPVIPAEAHRYLIYWVLHEALNAIDIKRSEYYLERFNERFGETVSARVRQHQLEDGLSTVVSAFNYNNTSQRDSVIDNW
jgi:hypothetical protein